MSSARTPEQWPIVFADRLNDGDLDGAVALYEPTARVVPPTGDIVVGHEGVRRMLAQMIATRARMQCAVAKVIPIDTMALVYNDWKGTALDAAGRPVAMHGKAIELVRRQPDGTWKLIAGDPHGRG